jgi:hypothetical protein
MAMVLVCVAVIRRVDQVQIAAVDSSATAHQRFIDLLFIQQGLHRVVVHRPSIRHWYWRPNCDWRYAAVKDYHTHRVGYRSRRAEGYAAKQTATSPAEGADLSPSPGSGKPGGSRSSTIGSAWFAIRLIDVAV